MNITFNDKLNKNFIKILTEKLLKWTGERWFISLSKEQGEETVYEKNLINKKNKLAKGMSSEAVKPYIGDGFTLVACGVDTMILASGSKMLHESVRQHVNY